MQSSSPELRALRGVGPAAEERLLRLGISRPLDLLFLLQESEEGTLARLMGDAILAFFGAPLAHEDDAARAILTGRLVGDGDHLDIDLPQRRGPN